MTIPTLWLVLMTFKLINRIAEQLLEACLSLSKKRMKTMQMPDK